MDPLKDCKRLFSKHFWERLEQRKVSVDYVFEIINQGKKERLSESKYRIRLGQWIVIAKRYKCRVVIKTVFPKKD